MPTETKGTPKGKRSVTFVVVVVALAVLIVIGTGFFLLPLVVSNLRAHAWEMKSRALIHDLALPPVSLDSQVSKM